MSSTPDIIGAHKGSSNHRAEILQAQQCACFYCCNLFPPSEIAEWVDEGDDDIGKTALCPRCGIDSVIVWHLGMDATFLMEMHAHWFL